jgi:drug/metabolite transporter (DMT)-like permease
MPADRPVATAAAGPTDGTAGHHPTHGTAARRPMVMVWLGVVAFSTGPVLAAGSSAPGVVFSFWRLWIGVAVLGTAAAVRRLRGAPPTARSAWPAALVCGVLFGGHQVALVSAIQTTSVVDVTLMNTIAPVIVGVLAVPLLGEHPGAAFRAWSAVAMAGAATVAVLGSTGADPNPGGMALAAVNVVLYAGYFLGSKVNRERIEPVPFLFGVMVGGALLVSAGALLLAQPVRAISAADLARCAAVAVIPGVVGHASITWALRWVPANVPPVVMLTIPLLSGTMAWVLLGQAVHPVQILAGAATLVGVAGAVRSPSARSASREALVLAEET